MTHPLWILNSALLMLSLTTGIIFYIMYAPFAQKESIDVQLVQYKGEKKVDSQINIKKIYENDLFGTYISRPSQVVEQIPVAHVPPPPEPEPINIPEIPEIQFLDPLDITLKGVVVFNSMPEKNRAIVENNKTGQESVVLLGDIVEDAKLIRIMSTKVIFLRSNGQQEILYVRQLDAKNDVAFTSLVEWDDIIIQEELHRYTVYVNTFVQRINNLGQFIDMLGLTTAYQKGKSIGCRVGIIDKQSFGPRLGLLSGDIILEIDGMPTGSTQERIAVYKHITHLKIPAVVSVLVLRNNNRIMFSYILEHSGVQKRYAPIAAPISSNVLPGNKQASNDVTYSAKELQKKEKAIMLQQGEKIGKKDKLSKLNTTE